MRTLNLVDQVNGTPLFNKFTVDDVLIAEYNCPLSDEYVGIWTHTDYLIHVLSGRKTWHTQDGCWTAEAGQTLFFKKGAAIVEQYFDVDFCLLVMFFPDNFVIKMVKELTGELAFNAALVDPRESAINVKNELVLTTYFQSMLTWLSGTETPPEPLLRIKLKELITSLLVSRDNPSLSAYFQSLSSQDSPSLTDIMYSNFRYKLSLEEFARLCHRSLSSFKRDFRKTFNESPGKWLLRKRLNYAARLLKTADMNVTQIMFESGFEDQSHFCRTFRDRFNMSPSTYRSSSQLKLEPVRQ